MFFYLFFILQQTGIIVETHFLITLLDDNIFISLKTNIKKYFNFPSRFLFNIYIYIYIYIYIILELKISLLFYP